jgi:excisionase family DNA binding protein
MYPKLLNGKEVAELLRVSKALAYRLMSQGDIPTIHISRKTVRVRQEDLEQFIAKNLAVKNSDHSKRVSEKS